MFRCEVAVKHTLLESERPKYLGTDDGMINIELMTKLYMVIAHNLNVMTGHLGDCWVFFLWGLWWGSGITFVF